MNSRFIRLPDKYDMRTCFCGAETRLSR